ncbi:MAG: penicillin-binding transpeptidase domain-containing protein, partial [Bacillota bacterium]
EIYEESKRFYSNKKLAAHVLGYVGTDNTGLDGIEKSLEKELAGTPGRIVSEKDAAGRLIPQAMHKYIAPVPGNSLVLTLDATIQHFVERELDKVVEKYQPKSASIIVMEPKTGGILAMANRPDFDPNNYNDYPQETWRNNAIWMNYEPGSTFKIVTAAAALDEAVVKPESRFYDPGFIMVADRRIKCWRYPRAHGAQSFEEVVQNSCNPGFVKIGLDLGKERFYKYIKAFGFGEKSGISLAGESKGIVIPEKDVKPVSIATISIGQSISVTPIQLVSALAAIANDGVLMKPQLVKEIRTARGQLVKEIEPEVRQEVVSKDTAKQLAGILEKVVSEGTGRNAFMEEYRVAGKTGTAQKAGPGGYMQGKYVASFAGFAPANDPRIAVLVVIDEPQGGIYYGGQIAAPVFRDVVRDILRYLNIPPQVNPEDIKEDAQKREVMVPDVVNTSLDEAHQILRQAGLKSRVEGSGNWVLNQQPKAGGRVNVNTQVILYVGRDTREIPAGQEVTMPDVTGLTMREAGKLLGRLGLRMDPQGSGVAVNQKVAPGAKIKAGTAVTVTFEPPAPDAEP